MCVRCYKCQVVVKEFSPDEWPKHIDGSAKNSLEKLDKWCLRRAIKRWNTRPPGRRPAAKKINLYEQEEKLQEFLS
jgi:hypothetical protein